MANHRPSRGFYEKTQDMLLILLPALDLDILYVHGAEGIDEGAGEACVRYQRDVVVDSGTADAVSVGQFPLAMVFRDIDYQLDDVLRDEVHDAEVSLFVWPASRDSLDAVVVEELRRTVRSIDGVALALQTLARFEQIHLALGSTDETRTFFLGTVLPTAIMAERSASLKSSPRQPTSPVELISTPSTGSALCRRAKENCEALTPIQSMSKALLSGFVYSAPSMMRVAVSMKLRFKDL